MVCSHLIDGNYEEWTPGSLVDKGDKFGIDRTEKRIPCDFCHLNDLFQKKRREEVTLMSERQFSCLTGLQ